MGLSAAYLRPRLATLAVVLFAAGLWLLLFSPAVPSAGAQDPPAEEAKGNGAPPADNAPSTNIVKHIVKSVGPVFGLILLVVSIALVALIVLLAMDLRMSSSIPAGFVED